MSERSPEEWRQLIAELEAIANNPAESKSRREKARGILNDIGRTFGTSNIEHKRARGISVTQAATAMEYDGTIV